MTFEVCNREFDSEKNFYLNGDIFLDVDTCFDENTTKTMEKNNYVGKYTFNIISSKRHKKVYDFVFVNVYLDVSGIALVLRPVFLPDSEFFDFLKDVEVIKNGYEPDCFEAYWTYSPYYESKYKTDEDELVSFEGNVRKINEYDSYVADNGINYQILHEDNLNPTTRSRKELVNLGLYQKMKDDSFMGKYIITCACNTGEIVQDEYFVSHVDNDYIYLNPISKRNMANIPFVIKYDDEDNFSSYKSVRSLISENYIYYDGTENISEYSQ